MSEVFHLLIHGKTKDVVGVVSRTAGGTPKAAELIGESLQLFDPASGEEHASIPAAVLEVKETAFNHRLIANPRAYQLTDQGTQSKSGSVDVTLVGGRANVTFATVPAATPAELWLRVEGADLAEPFTQAAQVTGTAFVSNPGGFANGNVYRVICFVQGQNPFIEPETAA